VVVETEKCCGGGTVAEAHGIMYRYMMDKLQKIMTEVLRNTHMTDRFGRDY